MTTHFDEEDGGREPDFALDDPLTVILRPSSAEYLGPPPGRYESIRRGANRRRLLRAAAGASATCAVLVLAALPFRLAHHDSPVTPTVPLAPPPASSGPTTPPTRPVTKTPTPTPSADPSRTSAPTTEPSRIPTTSASARARSVAPSALPTRTR
ncbi:hypothetical protein SAMN05216489_07226 [Streptomyces sp. 3213]|uniref:hypothetical protein n=1 Tax=Streptomyces sp. 3213.3 TaxID=1855348 RepID=UPI000897635C|nr:hypothetical protein [Streptomyces sp. 3213.3]SEE57839.1 hypothetical protein SAMN05216489_07226 [Streptomyces sp. 3213] [Streptomyces sp. 3213.3]